MNLTISGPNRILELASSFVDIIVFIQTRFKLLGRHPENKKVKGILFSCTRYMTGRLLLKVKTSNGNAPISKNEMEALNTKGVRTLTHF